MNIYGARMFRNGVFVASILTTLLAHAAKIEGTVDRQNALYKCGETATFRFKTVGNDKKTVNIGEMKLILSNDGGEVFETRSFDLAKDPNPQISGTMKVPGFLRCYAEMTVNGKKIWKAEGAGYEVTKIAPAAAAPADFKQFWSNAVKKAEEIPLDTKIEKLDKYSNSQYVSYKVSFAAPGGRVYGFLCIPNGKGPFPALISVPGAGPGVAAPDTGYALRGIAFLLMNVHHYDPKPDIAELQQQYKTLNKGLIYCRHDADDREKYFYYRAILGINRAVNWLAEHPDIDSKRIGYCGSSQGGALGLILGGLNPHISAVVANVPAMGDHFAGKLGRSPGWPGLIRTDDPAIVKTAGYYDTVNFARDIKCPVRVIVGFADTTCCPSSVYAVYNVINSSKQIINEVGMGHTARNSYSAQINWMNNYLNSKK